MPWLCLTACRVSPQAVPRRSDMMQLQTPSIQQRERARITEIETMLCTACMQSSLEPRTRRGL